MEFSESLFFIGEVNPMPVPRLIPRLTWSAIMMFIILSALSLFAFSFIFFGVMDKNAERFYQYFAQKIEPIFANSVTNNKKALLGKVERTEQVLDILFQNNPFMPKGAAIDVLVRDKAGNVIYKIKHFNERVQIHYALLRKPSARLVDEKMRRHFIWKSGSGLCVIYPYRLLQGGQTIGEVILTAPVQTREWAAYIFPILLLSFLYLVAFTWTTTGWIKKIRRNIDLLYLSLEKNLDNADTPPPSYVFEEFWQVAQWNKALAAQIQESMQFQSALFQNSPCGIFIIDPVGKILEVNTRAWELLQKVTEDDKVDSISAISEDFNRIVKQAATGRTDAGELTVQGRMGEVTLIYAIAPIQLPTWQGSVMFWLDHTEMKRLDSHLRQTDRYQLIGELASMAAHELRNPLTTIIANAQLGQIVHDESKQQELFLRIQQASARMNDFIRDLLGLCRPGEAQLSPMGLHPVISEVLGLVRAQLLTQGIEVELRYDPDVPQIWGEAKLLRQVFLNLIQNSIQAMSSGGRLVIKVKASGNEAIVTIQDTGIGIAPDMQGKIFESFITDKEQGTGLGLFITRRIMTQNFGGRIWFSSMPGEGTEFYLAFPLAEPIAQAMAEKTDKRYWTGKQTMIQ